MTGWVFVHSACIGCGRPFAYNPHRVPSVRVNDVREPICQMCVDIANPMRIKNGLEPIVVHPDAYEPIRESELYDAPYPDPPDERNRDNDENEELDIGRWPP